MHKVEWIGTAVHRLANAWLNANSARRAAITAASNQIEGTLQKNPLDVGESRSGKRRVLIEDPHTVTYEVDEPNHVVTVLEVLVHRQRDF